jgi:hypothetical protein
LRKKIILIQSAEKTKTYYWNGPDQSFGIHFKLDNKVKYALLNVVGVGVHGPSYPLAVLGKKEHEKQII